MTVRAYQIGILTVALIAFGLGAFFMANVDLPPWSPAVSAASVILFATPAIWAAKMWLGRRDALVLFAVLALFALLVELVAINTGIPYVRFGYSDHLGSKLFGVVPWTVSFAWPPLVLGPVLIGLTDRQPQINRSWVDWNTVLASVDDPETEISPWASEEVRLLADSDVFNKWFAHQVLVSETAFAPVC